MNYLNADIFRGSHGDCTNKGLSSRVKGGKVFLKSEKYHQVDATGYTNTDATKEFVCDLLENEENKDSFIAIEDICCGQRRIRAIPLTDYISGKWTMFGGNFIWTSDSRFFNSPVKIHDRIEG